MWLAAQRWRLMAPPRHLLWFFSSSSSPPPPSSSPARSPKFIVEYLIGACGLSRDEAERASRYISHIKSLEKPEAVLRLLRKQGLEDGQIRRLVLGRPTVLVADAEKTLEPKIKALLGAGFSGADLTRLISSSGAAMALRSNLLKAIDRNPHLLSFRIDERVAPTLAYLRSMGIPNSKILTIMMRSPYLVTSNRHGDLPRTGIFALALSNVSNISRSNLAAKIEFLMTFGWSQAELLLAFRRFPNIINLSRERVQATMDFLLKEAGCSPSYVSSRAVLLGLSLQKRLIPRLEVLRSLRIQGLPEGDRDLYSVMLAPEKKFIDKFILPNSQKLPELLEFYLTATAKTTTS
ncbi:unnamed protein product [Spirodela intermedia]|uniref:Uncharacterized protein n=1 Tax=Spirodela intermedia TaxID=51605 RepID=A0A7I8J3W2_SPIIN|nr:unnamed protein product [Spirodela intermedia]CAA6664453.1 unnamed protein product [Spirodela intermedia]